MKFVEDYYMDGINKGLSNYENYRWIPSLTIPMAEFLKKFLGINTGDTVLDYGCARGYVVKALRLLGVAAYGYDISEWAIANCDPEVIPYTNDDSPFKQNDTYDYLFSKDVLEHIHTSELTRLLPSLFAKTKHNALLIVPLADNGKYISPDDEKDVTHIQRRTITEWTDLFSSCTNNYSIFCSTNVPILKLSAQKYPGSTGFFYCVRHTDEGSPQKILG